MPRAFAGTHPPYAPGARFVLVGDTQRTSRFELWREQNDPERRRVMQAIAAQQPAFVVINGDLVFEVRLLGSGRRSRR